jgi:asparagine synthase (glutamine-hydrolysing)
LNDEWVSGFLGYGPSPNLTPFRGIYAVPPGCAVEIYDERMVITRFWLPDKSAQIKYKVDSEYEEHLRSLLRESVTARLRSEYNVWMHLSGGLDSSVLVGIADELAQSGVVPRMHDTVSCLYDLSPESDEFQFIAEVEKRRGRVGHHFNESAYPLLKEMDAVSADIPSYSQCFTYRERMICARMDELGARTQISGEGGDELLGNVLYGSTHVADLLHHGFIAQGVASAKIWGHCLKRSWLNILFQAFQQSLRLPDLFTKPSEFEEILTAEFCRRTNFRDRSLHTLDTIGFETPSGRQRSSAYLSVVRRLSQIPHRSFGNITTAYPYLHRPLVEFVLAIPADQLSRPGERRSLMRRAFRNVLPEKIWRRRSKRGPASALSIVAQREWNWIEAMLSNAIVFSRGYADERAVRTLARQVRHSIRPPVVLLQLLCLEAWLRDEQSWMPPQNRAVSSGWINA